MSDLLDELARLDPDRRDLFTLLSGPRFEETPPNIVRGHAETKAVPLSIIQERFWLFDQLQPHSCAYNVPIAIRLSGPLTTDLLVASVNEVVQRHEVLRMQCRVVDGKPHQVFRPGAEVRLPVLDLRTLASSDREAEALRQATAFARAPFDLENGSLVKGCVFHLDEAEHLFVLLTHHIVIDGWSVRILIHEIGHHYRKLATGQLPALPMLPMRYADFAVWQREQLKSGAWDSQLDYWIKELEGAPMALDLPTDRPRPALQTYSGDSVSFLWSPQLSRELETLSREEGVTLYMVLLAVFQILLYRYSDQEDIVVSTATSNRGHWQTESLIGSFANPLLLRTKISGEDSFREVLRAVRDKAILAYENKEIPFEVVAARLNPGRDSSRHPLFQVSLLVHETAVEETLQIPDLSARAVHIPLPTALLDMRVVIRVTDHGLQGAWEFSTGIFDRATIERMVNQFHILLKGIVADANQTVAALPILSGAERRMVLVDGSGVRKEYPSDKCIHQLIVEQAERSPNRVALTCGNRSLTYRDLNQKANQLARALIENGIRKGDYVPLLMEGGADVLVAELAVMKAGAAFVPLDPNWPVERTREVMQGFPGRVLLTGRSPCPPELIDGKAVIVVEEASLTGCEENVAVAVHFDDPIYAMFTSGSTGKPKAAVNRHGGIANRFFNMNDRYGVEGAEVVLATTSHLFDSSVWQYFWPLINGAKTVIPSTGDGFEMNRLIDLIEAEGVTFTDFVPAVLSAVSDEIDSDSSVAKKMKSLRQIIVGGDSIDAKATYRFKSHFSRLGITNAYGPTETSIGVIFYDLPDCYTVSIPIGKPLHNVFVVILDRYQNVVPVGMRGELYIGGVCVGLGYLNDQPATSAAFIRNPFKELNCRTLYKTGDFARYRTDGNLEFLGRKDRQVKIRGLRIELGEIETIVGRHRAVRDHAVRVSEEASGNKRIIAYVVIEPGEKASTSELHEFLKANLPLYMVPAAIVKLHEMPRTASGKIDRGALPSPELRVDPDQSVSAPENSLQGQLMLIWKKLLHLKSIGIYDSFFECGGHSLLAAQLVSRVKKIVGVEIPLRAFFEAPTLAGMAAYIEKAMPNLFPAAAVEDAPVLPPLASVCRREALPVSFPQEAMWQRTEVNPLGFELLGVLDVTALARSLNEIVLRHEILRTTYLRRRGVAEQIVQPAKPMECPMMDLTAQGDVEAQAERLREKEMRRAMDLRCERPMRARLLRLGVERHWLLLTLHHVVYDAWSLSIFFQELEVLYAAFARDGCSPLPKPAFQYGDYAVWQRNWMQPDSAAYRQQLEYWRGQLSGDPQPPIIPFARFNPPQKGVVGRASRFGSRLIKRALSRSKRQNLQDLEQSRLPVNLSAELSAQLRKLCVEEKATLFMVLLAGLAATFYSLSKRADLVIGTLIAGRSRVETESMLGFFVNEIVLRLKLGDHLSFRELLARVREATLGAYANQDVPFAAVAEALREEGRPLHLPIYFQFINTPRMRPTLSGLLVTQFPSTKVNAVQGTILELHEEAGRIAGRLKFDPHLYDPAGAAKFISHFTTILEVMVADPRLSLAQLWGTTADGGASCHSAAR